LFVLPTAELAKRLC